MTCSEVERVLPELLDGAPDAAFQADFETHVRSCPACSDLVSELKLIASEARQLTATDEPAPRVWVRIAAELRAEGLIREPQFAPARPILVPASSRRRWSAWWLAPVAAAVLAAGSYVVSHRPAAQVAKQQGPATPVTSPAAATPTSPSVPTQAPQQTANKSGKPRDVAVGTSVATAIEPEPNTEDQQFLSVVSTLAPSMRASYENELQAVNADIRESQAYLDRNPGDADARQHLMDAYQQKALLYQIALDRIQ
jgi:hypothetical protein